MAHLTKRRPTKGTKAAGTTIAAMVVPVTSIASCPTAMGAQRDIAMGVANQNDHFQKNNVEHYSSPLSSRRDATHEPGWLAEEYIVRNSGGAVPPPDVDEVPTAPFGNGDMFGATVCGRARALPVFGAGETGFWNTLTCEYGAFRVMHESGSPPALLFERISVEPKAADCVAGSDCAIGKNSCLGER